MIHQNVFLKYVFANFSHDLKSENSMYAIGFLRITTGSYEVSFAKNVSFLAQILKSSFLQVHT